MFKELIKLHTFSERLKNYGITSVDSLLAQCEDPVRAEYLRQSLGINVTSEEWMGAVAVAKAILKEGSK